MRIRSLGTSSIYSLAAIDAIELLGDEAVPTWQIDEEALVVGLQRTTPVERPTDIENLPLSEYLSRKGEQRPCPIHVPTSSSS